MNLVYHFVILQTILLIISNRSKALLQRKWKIPNSLVFCREYNKLVKDIEQTPSLRSDFCASFLQSNWDEVFPTISKKSSLSHCNCNSETDVINLGKGFYPHLISQRKCNPTSCCPQPYVCREVNHTVKVLKQRDINENEDPRVPSPLNHCWSFEEINVTVACHCELLV